MIISHKYKFIFIKTAKTAGTSIEVFLSSLCGPTDIVTPIIPTMKGHDSRNVDGFFNHISAHAIREKISPDCWDGYLKFCVERNPWDKTLSHYHMNNFRQKGSLTFEQFIAKRSFPINYTKYTEPNDPTAIIVDEILYYENFTDGLESVFKKLSVPFNGSLGVNAKSEYRTDRRHYRECYTPEQAEIIREAFQSEIQLHGYSF